jgi:uncharacterized protein YndB with AHSA1/START domain
MIDDGAADGTVRDDGAGHAVIRFTRHLPYPPDEVWSALTDPPRLRQWWGAVELDLRPGGQFDVRWLNPRPDGETFTMHAVIISLDPGRLLETRGDAHGILRWELTPEPGGTRLEFSSTLDLPDEFRTRILAGWHFHLGALDHVLGGATADLVEIPEWNAIHERYVARDG